MWTCTRSSCGNEWSPHLADWRLTDHQVEALGRMARAFDLRGERGYVDYGGFQTHESYVPEQTCQALERAGLARNAGHGGHSITDLGLAVYRQITDETS